MNATCKQLRCAAVWLAATALALGLAETLLPDLRRPLPAAFDLLLVRVAEWALLGCAAWLWLVTTVVIIEAARSIVAVRPLTERRVPGVPAALRRAVLVACGAAIVAGLSAPAMADPIQLPTTMAHRVAQGFGSLPVPGRLSAVASTGDAGQRATGRLPRTVVVRPGDSLWAIAAARLGPQASAPVIAAEWHRIYAANRTVIGDDPGLIEPGQRLMLPEVMGHE